MLSTVNIFIMCSIITMIIMFGILIKLSCYNKKYQPIGDFV